MFLIKGSERRALTRSPGGRYGRRCKPLDLGDRPSRLAPLIDQSEKMASELDHFDRLNGIAHINVPMA